MGGCYEHGHQVDHTARCVGGWFTTARGLVVGRELIDGKTVSPDVCDANRAQHWIGSPNHATHADTKMNMMRRGCECECVGVSVWV